MLFSLNMCMYTCLCYVINTNKSVHAQIKLLNSKGSKSTVLLYTPGTSIRWGGGQS